MSKMAWEKDGAEYVCRIGEITLWASPVSYAKGFAPKPARGTKWRAGCNHWSESTRCMSRYGRDAYDTLLSSAEEAKRLAETIYNETRAA